MVWLDQPWPPRPRPDAQRITVADRLPAPARGCPSLPGDTPFPTLTFGIRGERVGNGQDMIFKQKGPVPRNRALTCTFSV